MKRAFTLLALWGLFLVPQSGFAEGALPLRGFVEYDLGSRVVSNPSYAGDTLLHEAVFRLELAKASDIAAFRITTDVRWDEFLHEADIDIREAQIVVFPADWWEVNIGRQILHWGTGERVFVNDLFPKDWQSFLIGRDDEYLHAPVTAIRLNLLTDFGDLTAVMTPRLTTDTYIDGERLSYWGMDDSSGFDDVIERPAQTLANAEYHVRFTKNLIYKVVETAFYGYKGFFEQPFGSDLSPQMTHFPRLAVYGASVRVPSPLAVFSLESGYYDSLDDRDGTDWRIPNSMVKSVAGCKLTLIKNFTTTVQYSFEWIQAYQRQPAVGSRQLAEGTQHPAPITHNPEPRTQNPAPSTQHPATSTQQPAPSTQHPAPSTQYPVPSTQHPVPSTQSAVGAEYRDWITVELSHLRYQENLLLTLFGSYSPAEHDWFLRPQVTYHVNEPLRVTAGANLFFGEHEYSSFGQFKDNSNVFVRVRYTY